MNDFAAKIIKRASNAGVSGQVERIRDKRPVACPKIAVVIGRPLRHVRVIRRQDRAVVIDLRMNDQQAALIKIDNLAWQIAKIRLIFIYPCTPVIACVIEILLRAALQNVFI